MCATIICFVVLQKLKELKNDASLPIGFTKEGCLVDPRKYDCRLILLDDSTYGNDEVYPIDFNNNVALLIQHNSNNEAWPSQRKKISEFKWQPSFVDSFSHIHSDTFWKILGDLFSKNKKNKAEILDATFKHYYDGIHTFRTLDAWAALEIYCELSNKEDKKAVDQRSTIFDQLPIWIKDLIEPNDQPKPSLSESLVIADQIACDLMAR